MLSYIGTQIEQLFLVVSSLSEEFLDESGGGVWIHLKPFYLSGSSGIAIGRFAVIQFAVAVSGGIASG